MDKSENQESVDAIRQILFGQEKRILEDSIAQINAKFNALTERLAHFEELQLQNAESSVRGLTDLQNKSNQLEYKITGFQKEQNAALQNTKEQFAADLLASSTTNQHLVSELKTEVVEKDEVLRQLFSKLDADLNEKLVSKSQLASAFHAIANQFE